jgi:diguanylate cyclase (GGDEF)-like protein
MMEKEFMEEAGSLGNLCLMYEKKIKLQERKIYELRNLIGLGISLSSNLDFETLVESILYSCIGQLFGDNVGIMLQTDLDVDNMYIHMAKGYDLDFSEKRIIFQAGSPLLEYLKTNPAPLDYSSVLSLPELEMEAQKLEMLNPRLLVPMKSKESLNGIIVLGEKLSDETYSDDDREYMQDLGRFAAITVENSRLYLMGILDRMTRLFLHHYFQERLFEEVKRSVRNDTPLCLIMCDIDHFKRFNDTYGHQQGDVILKETAALFKSLLRSIDIPARYGGEEFAVILPETGLEDAIRIAMRLRRGIESFNYSGKEGPLHVTISLGVAQYDPDRDRDKSDFIARADASLYKAKRNGRNRVVAHRFKK